MTRLLAAALALALAVPAFAGNSASIELKAGYRAVALPVPSHQLAYVKPGDRVDLLVGFEAQLKDSKEKVVATILQNVVVLNVDVKGERIELELNPNEAQYAALSVEQKSSIWVSRRAPGDVDMKPMEMASFRKLFK